MRHLSSLNQCNKSVNTDSSYNIYSQRKRSNLKDTVRPKLFYFKPVLRVFCNVFVKLIDVFMFISKFLINNKYSSIYIASLFVNIILGYYYYSSIKSISQEPSYVKSHYTAAWRDLLMKISEFEKLHLELKKQKHSLTKLKQDLIVLQNDIGSLKELVNVKTDCFVDKNVNETGQILNKNEDKASPINQLEETVKLFDADKTGMIDFAMKSMGGEILSTGNTKLYTITKKVYIFGYYLFNSDFLRSPEMVLSGDPLLPGKCWPFKDFPGVLVIKLSHPIRIKLLSIEHVNKLLIPDNSSTPKSFEVYGMINENDDGVLFGQFAYNLNGPGIQNFKLETNSTFQILKVIFTSNYGNNDYTCVYRIRVHGNLANDL